MQKPDTPDTTSPTPDDQTLHPIGIIPEPLSIKRRHFMGTVLALDAATLLNACGGSTPPHDPMWVVTTLAGSEFPDFADGKGAEAGFWAINGMAADISGQLYVADTYNQRIRKISPAGVVSTLAGSATSGSADGTSASFNYPYGVAVDGSGNVLVADQRNHLIRQISPSGQVSTLAGSGSEGSEDGTGTAASFSSPQGVAVDDHGYVFVADYNNHLIRQINPEGVVSTLAGSGAVGSADGTAIAASFNFPYGLAVDGSGSLYVADSYNHLIRKISPAGVVSTLAGSGIFGSADGTGTAASFHTPQGVAVDASGYVFVADSYNHLIRKISPTGVVSTVAGSGNAGFANGPVKVAQFNYPSGVAMDRNGIVFVADSYNNRIRKISLM